MALADFANFKAPLPYANFDTASEASLPLVHNAELSIPSDHVVNV